MFLRPESLSGARASCARVQTRKAAIAARRQPVHVELWIVFLKNEFLHSRTIQMQRPCMLHKWRGQRGSSPSNGPTYRVQPRGPRIEKKKTEQTKPDQGNGISAYALTRISVPSAQKKRGGSMSPSLARVGCAGRDAPETPARGPRGARNVCAARTLR